MLFSWRWIRDLAEVDLPPESMAAALTARGLTVDALTRDGDEDAVLDVDIPANRPDCLGHLGLAREIAAAAGAPLPPYPEAPPASNEAFSDLLEIRVEVPDLCPRYTAGLVDEVQVGPSPPEVARRLERCGLRSVNNVVDASNWVLLELGQPVHTFDLDRLRGGLLCVRLARPGEVLTTLDGVERPLEPRDLVIADGHGPVALAGIMGGADSEIHGETRRVLVESACFAPSAVRRTARRLNLRTDASHRFERGSDPEAAPAAQGRMLALLEAWARGRSRRQIVDLVQAGGPKERSLVLREDRVRLILGYDPGREAVRGALQRLGLEPVDHGARIRVRIPSWRSDLTREVDLVEEVARHLGYDAIPSTLPVFAPAPRSPEPTAVLEERARDRMVRLGFHEAVTFAMIPGGADDGFVFEEAPRGVMLENPLSEHLAQLRRSLLPGLLQAADANFRRGARSVRLFEVARVFLPAPSAERPVEHLHLAMVWSGAALPGHWSLQPPEVAFHHLAGAVDSVLEALRPESKFVRRHSAPAAFHPGRAAEWECHLPDGSPTRVAWGGQLHPDVRDGLEGQGAVFAAELDLEALSRIPASSPRYRPVSKFPSVARDLSLLLPRGVVFGDVRAVLEGIRAPAPMEILVLDRYQGPPLEPGEVSVTVRVILEPQERTLTDDEVESFRTEAVEALGARLGVRIRE